MKGFFIFAALIILLNLKTVFKIEHPYFDEIYYLKSNSQIYTQNVKNWEHPPLGKHILRIGERIRFSNSIHGARLMTFLFSLFSLVLLYFIGIEIGLEKGIRYLPIFLALTDPFFLNLSKTAILESYVLTSCLIILLITLKMVSNNFSLKNGHTSLFLLTGFSYGVAASIKWSSVIYILVSFFVIFQKLAKEKHKRKVVFIFFAAFATYLLSYAPYVYSGKIEGLTGIYSFHKNMFKYHLYFSKGSEHESLWYTWPLLIKPIWLDFSIRREGIFGLFSTGNIFPYYMALILFIINIPRFFKLTNNLKLLSVLFWGMLFFWSISGREVQFFHYYYLSAPLLYLVTSKYLSNCRLFIRSMFIIGTLAFLMIYSPVIFYFPISFKTYKWLFFIFEWSYFLPF